MNKNNKFDLENIIIGFLITFIMETGIFIFDF